MVKGQLKVVKEVKIAKSDSICKSSTFDFLGKDFLLKMYNFLNTKLHPEKRYPLNDNVYLK